MFGIRMNISNVILKTTVPIIPLGQCQRQWSILSGGTVTISDKQICAGSKLHGTAPGDSGGPLLVRDAAGRLVQVGITSFGAGGGIGLLDQGTYPAVLAPINRQRERFGWGWEGSKIVNESRRE
uniref:Peptidase S1 domain-containing protein n=1 Tax=Angiostrongylus cantonensis TaxID=6313 RepID=A0A0K0CU87_ANGCA